MKARPDEWRKAVIDCLGGAKDALIQVSSARHLKPPLFEEASFSDLIGGAS